MGSVGLDRVLCGASAGLACLDGHRVSQHGHRRFAVWLQGKDYTLIREDDLIGVLPRSGATAADVPELKPLGDRVLLKVHRQFCVSKFNDKSRLRPRLGSSFSMTCIEAFVVAWAETASN